MNRFDELRSHFQTVRKQFEEADTLEEKQRLVAISQEIIWEAQGQITEFTRGFQHLRRIANMK